MTTDSNQTNTTLISGATREVLESRSAAVLVTLLDSPVSDANRLRIGAKLLVKESSETVGSLGESQLDDALARQATSFLKTRDDARMVRVDDFAPELAEFHGVQVLFERIEAEPRLIIAGAGHVGAALARLASLVGYRVTLIDDRPEFLDRELFAAPSEQFIDLILGEDWADSMRAAVGNGHGVSVAIVTRGHKQDEDCLRAVISSNPVYIGMIGSRRRTNIVLDKLREEGTNDEQLKKVRAPIGLDIGAVSPEEVALAILAEMVAERRGGSGVPLSSWRISQRST